MRRTLALAALALVACGRQPEGGDLGALDRSPAEGVAFPDGAVGLDRAREGAAPADRAPLDGNPLPLPQLSLYVNLGDSLAAGYNASAGHSYRALLEKNDDGLYPGYQGRDLRSRFPKLSVVDKAKSGATTSGVLTQALLVTGNPAGATLVVVSAGGNDFNDNTLVMIDPIQTAAVAKKATDNLQKIVDHFANPLAFPGGVVLVMLNVHDPTDGHGTIANRPDLTGFCTTILKLGLLAGPIVVKNLGVFNAAYTALAGTSSVRLVDNHAAFLGHGFHYDDPTSPAYKATDPTLWFANDCAHGNDRGHHELRRLIWKALTGEP